MNTLTTKRPSAAMIVAGLALSLAVGGSALAGADAANKTLTKSKVGKIATKQAGKVLNQREAGLNVNSSKTAVTAENAANAQNAATVGGVALAEIDFRAVSQSPRATVFEGSGLKLVAECGESTSIAIHATTTKSDSSIYTSVVDSDFGEQSPITDDLESGAFGSDDKFNVLVDTGADSGLATFGYHAPDGSTVTGTIATDEVRTGPLEGTCEAHGQVMAS